MENQPQMPEEVQGDTIEEQEKALREAAGYGVTDPNIDQD